MTLDEALLLQKGDHVVTKLTPVPYRPVRITEIWINAKQTIVQVRLASIAANEWLDATGYELPPAGKVWDAGFRDWVTRAEFRRRRTVGRRHGAHAPTPVPASPDDAA